MALFTDVEIATAQDLLPYESTLLQVAASHSINISQKLDLGRRTVGEALLLLLEDAGISDPQWVIRPSIGLSTVVVTPTVKRWLCFEVLSEFFGEAYNVQLNTRFDAKWKQYREEVRHAIDQTLHAGLGIVFKPLPKPHMPEVSIQQGAAPQEPLYVQVSWVDAAGNESSLSPIYGLVVGSKSGITVQTAEGALQAPPTAFGWNVYVGSSANAITLQNQNPLSIGSTWTLPASGVVNGPQGGRGQKPDFIVPISRLMRRG